MSETFAPLMLCVTDSTTCHDGAGLAGHLAHWHGPSGRASVRMLTEAEHRAAGWSTADYPRTITHGGGNWPHYAPAPVLAEATAPAYAQHARECRAASCGGSAWCRRCSTFCYGGVVCGMCADCRDVMVRYPDTLDTAWLAEVAEHRVAMDVIPGYPATPDYAGDRCAGCGEFHTDPCAPHCTRGAMDTWPTMTVGGSYGADVEARTAGGAAEAAEAKGYTVLDVMDGTVIIAD